MTDESRSLIAIRDQLRDAVTHLRSCSPLAAERLDALLSDLDSIGYFESGFVSASLDQWAATKLAGEVARGRTTVTQLLVTGVVVSEMGRLQEAGAA